MTSHLLTEIHDAEKEAKKAIEHARKHNQNRLVEKRETEEKELITFADREKEAGKETLKKTKEEAAAHCKKKLEEGKKEIERLLRQAEERQEEAVKLVMQTFEKSLFAS